jgi:dTDP-4-dehydrorhamnose 3,5-epimerase
MTATHIPGVRSGTVQRHADDRGAFRELWRASTVGRIEPADAGESAGSRDATFVQGNLSSSVAGVVRGLHLHRRQLDRWIIGSGRAFVALVDTRPMLDGASAPLVETRELAADDWVEIPARVAHGFMALDPVDLVYLVTNEYDGSDEAGFAWDDPLAAVPWPLPAPTPDGRPILSDRDRANPSLVELVDRLRAEDGSRR